jgi:hypothetical protein
VLSEISGLLVNQGKIEEAASLMKLALDSARCISDDYWKSRALNSIFIELNKQGKVEETETIMQEAIEFAKIAEEAARCYDHHR